MKIKKEGEREFVEYSNGRGRKVYTDAERFVDDEDFSDRIDEDNLPKGMKKNQENIPDKVLEKVSGLRGYKKLKDKEKKKYLKEKIPDVAGE